MCKTFPDSGFLWTFAKIILFVNFKQNYTDLISFCSDTGVKEAQVAGQAIKAGGYQVSYHN